MLDRLFYVYTSVLLNPEVPLFTILAPETPVRGTQRWDVKQQRSCGSALHNAANNIYHRSPPVPMGGRSSLSSEVFLARGSCECIHWRSIGLQGPHWRGQNLAGVAGGQVGEDKESKSWHVHAEEIGRCVQRWGGKLVWCCWRCLMSRRDA